MRIIRIPGPSAGPRSGFTQVPNASLRDERLSYKARGIHAMLLSNTDEGWTETADTLADKSPDGRHAARTGLQELVTYGYVEYRKSQGPDGRWTTDMLVYSSPKSENPTPVSSADTAAPKSENPTPVSSADTAAPESENPTPDRSQKTRPRHDQPKHEDPQVAPESGFPAAGNPDAFQNTRQNTNQKTINRSAQDRSAARWLHDRYRLTDDESAAVIAEVRARARAPIVHLVPYLTGMQECDLVDIVYAVMRPQPTTSPPWTHPPAAPVLPPWCGECEPHTRMTGDPDRPSRCPTCKPHAIQEPA